MRLLINLKCLTNANYDNDHVYYLHSLLYNFLKNTEYEFMHDLNFRKPFAYSNIFPIRDFNVGGSYKFIISSVDTNLIKHFSAGLRSEKLIDLNGICFAITDIKPINIKLKRNDVIETGTPIVIKHNNTYFGYGNKLNADEFFKHLSNSLRKKYNKFNNKQIETFNLINCFSNTEFKRITAVTLNIKNNKTTIIGSKWSFQITPDISEKDLEILQFNFDAGFGQKTSMGFGLINKNKIKGEKDDYTRISERCKANSK